MGILGLTHDEKGVALEKLPVAIKVAIGEGPDPDDENGNPRALFHFVFKRKVMRGGSVYWESAPDIAEVYGEKPTKLGVIFLHDDPREVFPSEYALWTRRGRFCHGELVQIVNGSGAHYKMQAIRRTREHPEGEPWPGERKYLDGLQKGQPVEGCGAGCPELESGNCGPSGDLYFILEQFPSLGAICRLHTGGKTSVPNLSNAVAQLHSWNGGRLKGVKAVLKVTPEMRWHPGKSGGWETSIVPILSLEIGGTTLESLITNMTEPARVFEKAHAVRPNHERGPYVVRESEEERASEIADEFYPQNKGFAERQATDQVESQEHTEHGAAVCELARRLGYSEARIRKLIEEGGGNPVCLESEVAKPIGRRTGEWRLPGKAVEDAV
jgi:Recombination directionality factor-like